VPASQGVFKHEGAPSPPATPEGQSPALSLLSVVIPALNEAGCIASMVEHLHLELRLHGIPHEIVVTDDGSTDSTWAILEELRQRIPNLAPVSNRGPHGFGRAVLCGLDHMKGDAVVIMMGDESDDCRDVVRYWRKLNEGWDCVFGSRFIRGGGTIDYPWFKLMINRLANLFIRLLFNIRLNDTTNAFKAYRRSVIDGCRPLIAPQFNLTVELPLKAIVRGYSWTDIPITWRGRQSGLAKLKIKEMGSRYLFICLYVWLEKYFSRGDYRKPETESGRAVAAESAPTSDRLTVDSSPAPVAPANGKTADESQEPAGPASSSRISPRERVTSQPG
jgi:dolichol-phosphate mannosyltransferase